MPRDGFPDADRQENEGIALSVYHKLPKGTRCQHGVWAVVCCPQSFVTVTEVCIYLSDCRAVKGSSLRGVSHRRESLLASSKFPRSEVLALLLDVPREIAYPRLAVGAAHGEARRVRVDEVVPDDMHPGPARAIEDVRVVGLADQPSLALGAADVAVVCPED